MGDGEVWGEKERKRVGAGGKRGKLGGGKGE